MLSPFQLCMDISSISLAIVNTVNSFPGMELVFRFLYRNPFVGLKIMDDPGALGPGVDQGFQM